ncbi:MAG: glycerol-3-phosphate acyltransferase, partial [bacterium]|nr:glycerol-3-phosphate acyltransferase [bacterium]
MLLLLSLLLALTCRRGALQLHRGAVRIDLRAPRQRQPRRHQRVFRAVGPRWGVLVFLLTGPRGAGAVLIMSAVAAGWPADQARRRCTCRRICGASSPASSPPRPTLSPFVGWHGGKGVANTCGAFFVLAPYPTLIALGVFFLVLACADHLAGQHQRRWSCRSPSASSVGAPEQFSRTIFVFASLICGCGVPALREHPPPARGTEAKLGSN